MLKIISVAIFNYAIPQSSRVGTFPLIADVRQRDPNAPEIRRACCHRRRRGCCRNAAWQLFLYVAS